MTVSTTSSMSAPLRGRSRKGKLAASMLSSMTSAVRRTEVKLRTPVSLGKAAERLPQVRKPVPKALKTVRIPASLSWLTSQVGSERSAVSGRSMPVMPRISVLLGLYQ
ncbi:hypothetical protein D3C87_1825720 [compost metagenome]